MWNLTIRGIVAHRARLALSVVAVALAVAFVTGAYALTDTLDRSYSGVFAATQARVDLVVALRDQRGPEGTRQRLPEEVRSTVAAVPGVAEADGVVRGSAQFVDRDGQPIRVNGAPTLAVSWSQRGSAGPLGLVGRASRAPRGPGEVAVDVATARDHGFTVGRRVRVIGLTGAREYRISGLFSIGGRTDLGGVTFASFDLATTQGVVGAPGRLDEVAVHATPGESVRLVRRRIATAIGPGFEVRSGSAVAADAGTQVRTALALLTAALLGFAAVGVVVAVLLVFNTFTIVMAQRTREVGLIRLVGASSGQVVAALVGEALVVGAVAAALGIVLGLVAVPALFALVRAFGLRPPGGAVVVSGRTLVVAGIVGVGSTALAALRPAVRAARRPPLAALDAAAPPTRRASWWRSVAGIGVLVVGAALLWAGPGRVAGDRHVGTDLGWTVIGAAATLVGAVLLVAPILTLRRRGRSSREVAVHLAGENVRRTPRRAGATASALVVGAALVVAVATFSASTRDSIGRAVDGGVRAELVLRADGFAGFSPEVAARVAALPEVAAVSPFQYRQVRIDGAVETVVSARATGLARTVDLGLTEGRIAALEPDGILVQDDAARAVGVGVGDVVSVQMANGTYPLRVAGLYRDADFTGGFPVSFVVPREVYKRGFGAYEPDVLAYVAIRPGTSARAADAVSRALATDFPDVAVLTRAQYRADQQATVDRFLAVVLALLLLAEGIAVLGVANALLLSVLERTREIGLLRAVGMTGEQVRRMVRREALIVASVGTVVGASVGLAWGRAFTAALRGQGITTFVVPVPLLVAFLGVSWLAAFGAAAVPARRAARLDVLAAVGTQ